VNKRLSVGLIGVGGFGASHLKALQQLETEDMARLVCVADPSVEGLADTRRMLESRGVRWHTDHHSLLEQESELDAVVVAAPIHLHMEITATALARDLFVYLEKPPVPLIQQINRLIDLDVSKQVAVGFQLINSKAVQQLKLWKTQGGLGEIKSICVHGCSPRSPEYYRRAAWAGKMVFDGKPVFDGPATNALSHWLHNVLYLAGEQMDEFGVPAEIEAELYRAKSIESYDLICMRGRLRSGTRFHYTVTHATGEARPCTLEIIGSKGRAWVVENTLAAANDLGLSVSAPSCPDPFVETWRQFVRFARGERPRVATRLEDTRGYVLATNAALMSSGGIHDIGSQHSRTSGHCANDSDKISGLADLVERSAREGRLFSEMSVHWARKGAPIQVQHLQTLALSDYL
jgi:predicted dehydrogenase